MKLKNLITIAIALVSAHSLASTSLSARQEGGTFRKAEWTGSAQASGNEGHGINGFELTKKIHGLAGNGLLFGNEGHGLVPPTEVNDDSGKHEIGNGIRTPNTQSFARQEGGTRFKLSPDAKQEGGTRYANPVKDIRLVDLQCLGRVNK